MNKISGSKCRGCGGIIKMSDPFPYHITEGTPIGAQTLDGVICVSCYKKMFEPAIKACNIDMDNLPEDKCALCGVEIEYDSGRMDTYPRYLQIEQRMEDKKWIILAHADCFKKFKKAMRDAARSIESCQTDSQEQQSSVSTETAGPA